VRRAGLLVGAAAVVAGLWCATSLPLRGVLRLDREVAATRAALARTEAESRALGAEAAALRTPAGIRAAARRDGLVPAGSEAFVVVPPPSSGRPRRR
jgi:cell division protein FtsB